MACEYSDFGKFYDHYLAKYKSLEYIHDPNRGHIVWRRGAGLNVELLHIRAYNQGLGHGPRLIRDMLTVLRENPPFHSVFGMMLASNEAAISIYRKMGCNLTTLPGLYRGGDAVIMCQEYEAWCKRLGV